MSASFRTIQDILDASRRDDSLYSIYQRLEDSKAFLKERQKNAFEVLFEILIPSLTEEQSQELATFPTESLEIYATTISLPIAQALSSFKGQGIYLNGIQQIDEATAKALSQFKGSYLFLGGLKQIDEATAKVLSQWPGSELSLNGLETVDEATGKALAQRSSVIGVFNLDKLRQASQLNNASVKLIIHFTKYNWLTLNALKQIDKTVIKTLIQFEGSGLSLDGVEHLDKISIKILAQYQGDELSLNGLQHLNDEEAKALVLFKGSRLYLNSLQTIDEKTAKALALFTGKLFVNKKIEKQITKIKEQFSFRVFHFCLRIKESAKKNYGE